MCAEPIGDEHQHVVNVESRGLMCTCRSCYLLFTAEDAALRYPGPGFGAANGLGTSAAQIVRRLPA